TTILEIGAGTGRLACELLLELEVLQSLPQRYCILEPSADLQVMQHQFIEQHAPHLLQRVTWLHELPHKQICGVIIGNEVLDVLPVDLFEIRLGGLYERGVAWHEGRFQWQQQAADAALENAVLKIGLSLGDAYQSEVSQLLPAWITSVGDSLQSGLLLLIDYGYARREYYHPQRNMGTLMCHYRHRAHQEPFVYPGLQDITAHVDFTAVAEAAVATNLHVAGYNTQGQFLLSCGIDVIANDLQQVGNTASLALSQQIKQLTLPSEMGEIFKVIGLTRNFDENLLGFSLFDMRGKL
ncbi:MAG: class I SAM-dependent methyltransferase, partial [Thiohalomonadales bacterium]